MSALNWLVKRLLDPIALVWLVLLVLGILQWRRKRRLEASVSFLVFLLLSVFGGTSVPQRLIGGLERPYVGVEIAGLSVADVVIVLGGHISRGDSEPHGFDSGEAVDRILAGIELIRANKGKLLLLGGGAADFPPHSLTEYEVLKPWIDRWNLVDVPVEHIGLCRNTFEEAQAVRRMQEERGWKEIILVTSALHMRRAEEVFKSSGVSVTPVACDFRSIPGRRHYLIPRSDTLRDLKLWLHEMVGRESYRLRGWIKE